MKDLAISIFEGTDIPALKKFTKHQVASIEAALPKSKITFKSKDGKKVKGKFTKSPQGYIHLITEYEGFRYSQGEDCQAYISDSCINMYPWVLSNENISYRDKSYDTTLVSIDYDPTKKVTTFVYRPNYGKEVHGDYFKGDIIITMPGNIVNPEFEPIKFSEDGYIKYMKKFLGENVRYFKAFEWDEDVRWATARLVGNDRIEINIELQVGKGYSSHEHSCEYHFTAGSLGYDCDRMLADRSEEAQIVRKFEQGLMNFQGSWGKCPQHLDIYVHQELD